MGKDEHGTEPEQINTIEISRRGSVSDKDADDKADNHHWEQR